MIGAVALASTGLLWYYFNAFFFRFSLRGLPIVESHRVERALSLIASGVVAYGAWLLATRIAAVMASNTP